MSSSRHGPDSFEAIRRACSTVPYGSSLPCKIRHGQRTDGNRYSIFQWRNAGLSQISCQARKDTFSHSAVVLGEGIAHAIVVGLDRPANALQCDSFNLHVGCFGNHALKPGRPSAAKIRAMLAPSEWPTSQNGFSTITPSSTSNSSTSRCNANNALSSGRAGEMSDQIRDDRKPGQGSLGPGTMCPGTSSTSSRCRAPREEKQDRDGHRIPGLTDRRCDCFCLFPDKAYLALSNPGRSMFQVLPAQFLGTLDT
jgi:hypothetical protein